VYRSIEHTTTGKSPAELLFNRKIRGKLPNLSEACKDQQVCDRDAEEKAKAKKYADDRRGAQYSKVNVGDTVLVQQEKVDKFTTPFNPIPHQVVSKTGNQVTVESPTGAKYTRNTTHVERFNTNKTAGGTECEQTDQNTNSCCPDSNSHDQNPKADFPNTPKLDRPQRTR